MGTISTVISYIEKYRTAIVRFFKLHWAVHFQAPVKLKKDCVTFRLLLNNLDNISQFQWDFYKNQIRNQLIDLRMDYEPFANAKTLEQYKTALDDIISKL